MRAELAAIAPTRRCDRLAEISGALPHAPAPCTCVGRGAVSFHLDLAVSAAVRRAFALLAELRVPAEIRTYTRACLRPRDALPAPRRRLDERALAILAEAGVLDADHRPLDRPPGRVVARARAAVAPTCAARSSEAARSPARARRTSRCGRRRSAGASFLRSVASAEEVRLKVERARPYARAYAKGWEEIEGYLLAAGVVDAVLALEERSVVAEMRAEANRLANADHANLVRTAHAAQAPARSGPSASRLRCARVACRSPLREAATLRLRHPALSLRELAERASPPTTKASMQRRLAKVVELAGSSAATICECPRGGRASARVTPGISGLLNLGGDSALGEFVPVAGRQGRPFR